MIFRNLMRRKFRTAMFIVGISVILTGMQVLLGITHGLDSQIEDMFRRDGIDLVAIEANSPMVFNSTIKSETWEAVAREPNVKRAYGAMMILAQTPEFPMLIINGIEPDRFGNYHVLEGRHPQSVNEVAIGKAIRNQFGVRLGETIDLFKTPLTVVGLYESGIETEDGAVLLTLLGLQTMMDRAGTVSFLGLQVESGTDLNELTARLSDKFPMLTFTTGSEYVKTQQNIQLIKGIATGMGWLSIVGGSIIVFIFSLIIVQERTREIGLLRAVGWSSSRVMRLILGETLVLAFAGVVLSLGISWVILAVMVRTPSIVAMLPVKFTWNTPVITLVIALVLGFAGGMASAYRASRLNVLEAFGRE